MFLLTLSGADYVGNSTRATLGLSFAGSSTELLLHLNRTDVWTLKQSIEELGMVTAVEAEMQMHHEVGHMYRQSPFYQLPA